MSKENVSKVFDRLKEIIREKKNLKDLDKYVETIEIGTLECLVASKLLSSTGPEILEKLFIAMRDGSCQIKKLKVMQKVLYCLKSEDVLASRVRSLLMLLLLELPRLRPAHLATLAADCIDSIRDNSDLHTSWKDVLPECIRLVTKQMGTVSHYDVEVQTEEFAKYCVTSLCHFSWSRNILIPLAAMFIEIKLTKDEHLLVVNKLCGGMVTLPPESLPPLIHQLLTLCKDQHATVVYFRLGEYFTSRLYPQMQDRGSMMQDSESPDLDNLVSADASDEVTLRSHATCVLFAGGGDSGACVPRHVLNALKMAARRPSAILSCPTLLHILLANEHQRDACLQIVKSAMLSNIIEKQRRAEFTWCADALPEPVNVEQLIKTMVESSKQHCQMSVTGLLVLATGLSTSLAGFPTPAGSPHGELRLLGHVLLARLSRAYPDAASQGLRRLTHAPSLVPDVLKALYRHAGLALSQCLPELRLLAEECLCYQRDSKESDGTAWRCRILEAIVPISVRTLPLRDALIMLCRKGLFSRDPGVGRVAVSGFMSLLGALPLRTSDMASLSQDFSSSNHSVLTQISIDVHCNNANTSRVNNAAVSLEIVSSLRKCLSHNWEVREQLYIGLPYVLSKRPELTEALLELLHEHMTSRLLAPSTDSSSPLMFDRCAVIRDNAAVLQEPLGKLMFCLQKVLVWGSKADEVDELGIFGRKLIKTLTSVAERMTDRTPLHFHLDDGVNLGGGLPDSQSRCLELQQILLTCEASQALCLGLWKSRAMPQMSQTILGLHRTHHQLIDFAKTNCKAKKTSEKSGVSQKSQKDETPNKGKGNKKRKKDGAGTKGSDKTKDRVSAFKQPNTVWDMDIVLAVVELLYSGCAEWVTKEESTQLRTNRMFHRQAMRAAVGAVKASSSNHGTPSEQITAIAEILYTNCIKRLDDFADFDQETALLVVECFYQLYNSVADKQDKLIKFLLVCGSESESDTELVPLIDSLCDSIAHQVVKSAEGCAENDDPSAAKIPPALLRVLCALLAKLPANTPTCDKWSKWLTDLCSQGDKSKWVGASAVAPLLELSARSRNPWGAVEVLVEAFSQIMGVNKEDTQESSIEEYCGPLSCLNAAASPAFLSLCAHLNRRIGSAELVTSHLKAETQAVLPYKSPHQQQTGRSALKNRERALCAEVYQLCCWCRRVALILSPLGAPCDAALKLLTRLHALLADMAQHFMLRDPTALLNSRFDRVVKAGGRTLSHACDTFINYAEAAHTEKGGLLKVKRDIKNIPKLVFEMEDFRKRVMQLSMKTKLDLLCHLAQGSARDFRITASAVKEALRVHRGEDIQNETDLSEAGQNGSPPNTVQDNTSNSPDLRRERRPLQEEVIVEETEETPEEDNDEFQRTIEEDIAAAIKEAVIDSDDDGTSKRGSNSDSDTSTNLGSEDEDSRPPSKKKRLSS